MADAAYALAAACRHCGMKAEVLPPQDERDIGLGRRYTSSRECFPMICTTGSLLRKLMEPGVNPGEVSFFMPDHNGPCRFGQYNGLQRIILDRLGFREVEIVHPSNENSYAGLSRGKNVHFRLAAWRGIVAVDILRKLLQERRPYEARAGETAVVYRKHLDRVIRCTEGGGRGIADVLRGAIEDFRGVSVVDGLRRPVISVVGEIFMRDNPFCSGRIVQRLEELGAETVMGPVRDWINYSTYRYTRDSSRKGRPVQYLLSRVQGLAQKVIEERLAHLAEQGGVEMQRDVPLAGMLELAMPYVHRDYDGDPIIALGSSCGQHPGGISGVVNILPFTCLPGTLVAAVSSKLSEDHDGLPWLDVAFDGQEDAGIVTRLEAFTYRAREYARRKGLDTPREW